MTAIVETRGVSKHFGDFRALDDVSVAVSEGEFVSIVGPNGAGKTTLVNLLTGLLVPTSGQVFFKGADIAGIGPVALAKRGMARTFQLVQIFPQLTVAETIAAAVVSQQDKPWRLFADLSSDAAVRARVDEIARIFGLEGRLQSVSRLLSQGEKKLLDVASAFALKPEVILLDEPTSGLDPATEERIMKLFRQIAESGRTVIMTTHAMENVKLFDKIVVMMRGKLVFYGAPDDALKYLNAKSFKGLFDRLEKPVEEQVREHGEANRVSSP